MAEAPIPPFEAAPDPAALLRDLDALLETLPRDAAIISLPWGEPGPREAFAEGAANLALYLALRRRDLRPLQRALMVLGLSSLGRLEGRVLPTLHAVRAALAAIAGAPASPRPTPQDFFAGERALARHTAAVLGPASPQRPVRLLVTCPSEAADEPGFLLALARRGVEAIRINCAHDDAPAWERMVAHARAAEAATGHRLRILMDLAGPKIRTGAIRLPPDEKRLHQDDTLAIVPPGGLDAAPADMDFGAECTLAEVLCMVEAGHRLFVDDGKVAALIERVEPWGLACRVTHVPEDGAKLKSEKGLNFPDSVLRCSPLSAKDLADLDTVIRLADGIEYSFVQSAEDVRLLQRELAARRPADWRDLSLVLKIETTRAVRALPGILAAAAWQQPTALMIARGDLAVEIGFGRVAEMQEEMLWLGEAAQVPVIWATQVLEHTIRKGTPLRGEMTDAAMGARAECIMLNKGPHLLEAIDELDALLPRMEEHQHKKTPQLRRLTSW